MAKSIAFNNFMGYRMLNGQIRKIVSSSRLTSLVLCVGLVRHSHQHGQVERMLTCVGL